jgi:Raf kinase inhibitor-like YbhB/YbcL family protein
MKIEITSAAFAEGEPIPPKHTCDGRDLSPPLHWSKVPPGTRSLALIVDDPDAPAGTWVHWVLYGLSPELSGLPDGVGKSQYVLNGARQGLNDFKRLGYGGPCPPPGKPHRYFFKLYALDAGMALEPGVTKKELLQAMEGHVIGEGRLMGTYQRK